MLSSDYGNFSAAHGPAVYRLGQALSTTLPRAPRGGGCLWWPQPRPWDRSFPFSRITAEPLPPSSKSLAMSALRGKADISALFHSLIDRPTNFKYCLRLKNRGRPGKNKDQTLIFVKSMNITGALRLRFAFVSNNVKPLFL